MSLDRAHFFTLGLGLDGCQLYYYITIQIAIKQVTTTVTVTTRLTRQEGEKVLLSDNYQVNPCYYH